MNDIDITEKEEKEEEERGGYEKENFDLSFSHFALTLWRN